MHMICTLVMFEMGKYTLGMGGADDVLWSSVVSLRWWKGYIERGYCSCFYEMTKHKECTCVQVCMRMQGAYVVCVGLLWCARVCVL